MDLGSHYRWIPWLVAGISALAAAAGGASPPLEQGLGAGPRLGTVHVVDVALDGPGALETLVDRGFDVARVDGAAAEVYAVPEELDLLDRLGFAYTQTGLRPDPPEKRPEPAEKALGVYNSYASMTAMLEGYAAAYPGLCRLESLGRSVQGRELWLLRISGNPDVRGDKPAFKYVSTAHGDEPLGTELCLYFIDLLLGEYGTNARITAFVDTTLIAIVPLMNPDGLEAGSRYNANGYDLNRSFPAYGRDYTGTLYDGEPLHDGGRQPEVAHVMRWVAGDRFVLSANLHTGALVVNYPYDEDGVPSGANAPTPDDALFRDISRRYSIHNPPMWASPVFTNGITNGSRWYAIFGGMQDWNYRYAACNEVTLELAYDKRPAQSLLPQYWVENAESMLSYAEAAHIGVRGEVTDIRNGAPVHARVTVQGNSQPVFSHPDTGVYHRMLLPGAYTLSFSARGYLPRTVQDIAVVDGPAARVDVALELAPADVNDDGRVDAIDVQYVINAALGYAVDVDCDVNGDGRVDAIDVQIVIVAALG